MRPVVEEYGSLAVMSAGIKSLGYPGNWVLGTSEAKAVVGYLSQFHK